MALARSQPIAIPDTTRMKNAAIEREQIKLMLRNMYVRCGHSNEDMKKIQTLSEAGFVYEPRAKKRESIGPATVRSEAPPDWSSETKFVWYSGEQCSITIEMHTSSSQEKSK